MPTISPSPITIESNNLNEEINATVIDSIVKLDDSNENNHYNNYNTFKPTEFVRNYLKKPLQHQIPEITTTTAALVYFYFILKRFNKKK